MVFGFAILGGKFTIYFPIAAYHRQCLFIGCFFDFGRHTHDNRVGWNNLILHDDRTRRDNAVFTDFGTVEYRRMHADDAVFANGCAVHDGAVTYRNIVFDNGGKMIVHMHDGVVLYIAVFSDDDGVHVAT